LAGHDATRALAKMDIKLVKDEYDDLTGLNDDDLEEAKEWEQRMACKQEFFHFNKLTHFSQISFRWSSIVAR
jgi:hypothetical protein